MTLLSAYEKQVSEVLGLPDGVAVARWSPWVA